MKTQLLLFVFLASGIGIYTFFSKSNTMSTNPPEANSKNVLGTPLQTCCTDPMTGFYRNGRCETGPTDYGTHVVCAEMTEAFLTFTKSKGNDLSTPRPELRFPGLKPGDKWCLCALRWREAWEAGVAPPVVLERTHEKALRYMKLDVLREHAKEEAE